MCAWYGHLGAKNTNRLSRIMASKMIGKEQKQLECKYRTQVKQKARQNVSHPIHVFLIEFIKLSSGRDYKAAKATKKCCT